MSNIRLDEVVEIKIEALNYFVDTIKQCQEDGFIDDPVFIKNLELMVATHIDVNYKPEES